MGAFPTLGKGGCRRVKILCVSLNFGEFCQDFVYPCLISLTWLVSNPYASEVFTLLSEKPLLSVSGFQSSSLSLNLEPCIITGTSPS